MLHTNVHTQVQLYKYVFFTDLPAGERFHDLITLLNFDASKVLGETLGVASIHCHQEILQEPWSSGDVAVLPGADVQQCLLGVHAICLFTQSLLPIILIFYNYFHVKFQLTNSTLCFQANRILKLALHLEKTVINLKMDALWLWNIALTGTVCGNLLNLIENTYGYLETKASIE